jgi:uroporphyrinogen-III decarboxylase
MTSKHRYLDMLAGNPVDFVPRVPILMQFAAEYIGSNYGAFASDHRVMVESNFRCAEDFGMDQVSTISDPYRETQGFGGEVHYVRDGVPRCPHPPLEDSKDLSRLAKPDPRRSPRMLDRVQAVEQYVAQAKDQYSILGWVEGPAAEAADCRGVQDFSPDVYHRLIQPREKKLVRAIQQAGGLVRLHICGNITHLLDGIADLAVNVLDVDHMVDMAKTRQAVGPKVTLAGNLDPAAAIRFGKPAAIRDGLKRIYEQVGNPFLVNAGCEIPPGTPNENLKALCEPLAFRR